MGTMMMMAVGMLIGSAGGEVVAADDPVFSAVQIEVIERAGEQELLRVLAASMQAERRGRTLQNKETEREAQRQLLTGEKCPSPDGISEEQLGLVRIPIDVRWSVMSVHGSTELLVRPARGKGERMWVDTVEPSGATTDTDDLALSGWWKPLGNRDYQTVGGTRDRVMWIRAVPNGEFDRVWRGRIGREDWPEVRDKIVAEARRTAAKAVRRR